ncbi:MAG: ribose-5-phosphate isomerase RpiA [Chloroflexota bacterium]|nr:ribose-5-phosphate isomerase RpiA [Chloroflexota bacterium]
MNVGTLKKQAGEYAARFVKSGMVVGLGSGSTAIFATRRIAHNIDIGALKDIRAIPTSLATEERAIALGIPLTTLAEQPRIDITIDGADEVDPAFNLIKGGGGAHLREKIVAQATERLIIAIDASKRVSQLGSSWAIPIEVIPFGWEAQARYLETIGATPKLRLDGDAPFQTDQGNLILDADFGPIADPAGLARQLEARAGIVEHGLFIGMARDVVVAGGDGVRHLRRQTPIVGSRY